MTTARRLWALDGPTLSMDRTELLDGAEPGRITIPVPSWLIEHDDGLVLYDTGFAPEAVEDAVAAYGEIGNQIAFTPGERVDRQVEALGFGVDDVTHVVLSHIHFDHTGGLRLFPSAHFLTGAAARPIVEGTEGHDAVHRADFVPVRDRTWIFVEGDHDVFGDDGVVMLAMPGHAPGNTSLLVRLPQRTILLTADTAHLRSALETRAPMGADTDRDAAVRSLGRVVDVARETGADIWVGHDPDDWERFGAPGPIVV